MFTNVKEIYKILFEKKQDFFFLLICVTNKTKKILYCPGENIQDKATGALHQSTVEICLPYLILK